MIPVAGQGPVNPAIQMRAALERARRHGDDFDEAWALAWMRIKWPHDTTHRREWKAILGSEHQKEIWRTAYYDLPAPKRQLAARRLDVALAA